MQELRNLLQVQTFSIYLIGVNPKILFNWYLILDVFYNFELQMVGVILLPVMTALGIFLWFKRRKARKELEESAKNDEAENL